MEKSKQLEWALEKMDYVDLFSQFSDLGTVGLNDSINCTCK